MSSIHSVYTRPLIQEYLLLIEERMRAQVSPEHLPDLRQALDHLLAAGGKRIRPTLIVLLGTMLGAPQEKIVTLGAAVEMLHTATLVHDDLIDGALLRRGMPTLNAHWSPAATVLTGDYLFACAAHLAAEIDSLEIMRAFAETLAVIVNGELTQLFEGRGVRDREHYYRRIYAKTASLFEMSTRGAALISPVERAEIEHLARMGYHIGMAFQIMDDILDFTGEQATLGKPIGSDLRQGLITLPALYYIESHPHDPYVHALLSGQWHNEAVANSLIESIRQSEALAQAQAEAQQYALQALQILHQFSPSSERQAVEELIRFVVERRS
uniref:Octaprenyl-diphosphate synthase n=2 Tax=uncultured Chloroflexota bacterium TaxID=166587 RepID=H5SF34_9CHLR|nr:octaprenyl-diphosphate synthase [uncultured Chloroflexota bacterium]